jgi:putative aldouronate transport system substrate-binding protein
MEDAPSLSRRALIRIGAGGGAALLLSACAVAPSAPSAGPQTAAGPTPASVSKNAAVMPSYVPLAGGPKPDFPSAGPEYEDGFLRYPANAQPAWHRDPPGKGSVINAFTLKLSANPATPYEQNPAWQETQRQLNATVNFNSPLQADYLARIATIMAGSDLPDLMLFNGGLNVGPTNVPNLAQFLEQSMADLTPYLGGDAAKDYPFLAAIPTYAWTNSGCAYNGKLYMWPLQRYLPGTALIKNVDMWNQEFGVDYMPKNADDFKRMLLQVTNPGAGRYGLGGSAGVVSGGALGLQSVLRLFPSIFGAPNNWRQDGSSLVKDYETPEYRESILYLRDLVSSGVFFPDSLTNPSGPTTQSFPTGKAAMTIASFGVTWTSMYTALQSIKPAVNWLPLAPFAAHDGAKPVHHLGPGFLVTLGLKKAPPERLKELLGIVDWLTAPFGSAEDLLLTYGIPGVDHTVDESGRPVATPRASPDVDAVGWKYVSQRPQVMTWPAWPDYAKVAYDFEHVAIPVGIADPTLGVVSQMNFARGVQINQVFTDAMGDIVLGRRQAADFDQLVKDWQNSGGSQIRTELQRGLAG